MKTLALDISTKTGWSLFRDQTLVEHEALGKVNIEDFNVNNDPNKSPKYPINILLGAQEVARRVGELVKYHDPDVIVIENTVRGKNRHTQRLLEWIHLEVYNTIITLPKVYKIRYMDPSEWRAILELRMSKDDKKNNALVSKGKKRGKVTKKHLAVRRVNEIFGLKLKIKDNDIADAILLGLASVT